MSVNTATSLSQISTGDTSLRLDGQIDPVYENLTILGTLTVDNLVVKTLKVTGTTTLLGGLTVTGATVHNGNITVNGVVNVN